jgi:hypothetical protein
MAAASEVLTAENIRIISIIPTIEDVVVLSKKLLEKISNISNKNLIR